MGDRQARRGRLPEGQFAEPWTPRRLWPNPAISAATRATHLRGCTQSDVVHLDQISLKNRSTSVDKCFRYRNSCAADVSPRRTSDLDGRRRRARPGRATGCTGHDSPSGEHGSAGARPLDPVRPETGEHRASWRDEVMLPEHTGSDSRHGTTPQKGNSMRTTFDRRRFLLLGGRRSSRPRRRRLGRCRGPAVRHGLAPVGRLGLPGPAEEPDPLHLQRVSAPMPPTSSTSAATRRSPGGSIPAASASRTASSC